jgi:Gamma-glutamyl cyclotransferase, AIG2-like
MSASRAFVYGTLQVPRIVKALLKREPETKPAKLQGYARYRVKDALFPAIVPEPSSSVQGMVRARAHWRAARSRNAPYLRRMSDSIGNCLTLLTLPPAPACPSHCLLSGSPTSQHSRSSRLPPLH